MTRRRDCDLTAPDPIRGTLLAKPAFGALIAVVLVVASTIASTRSAAAQADAAAGQTTTINWDSCSIYDLAPWNFVRCGHALIDGPAPAMLPFVVIQAARSGPSESAVLFLQGGPGLSSGLDPVDFAWPSWAELAQLQHDLIVFDQRGTGVASPGRACPEFRDVVRPALAAGLFSPRSIGLFDDAKAVCHDDLVAVGYDLAQFTVRQMAADVVALMEALPYSDWTLFGSSYGSRLALELMRMQPEGIRGVVLDGAVPPELDLRLEVPILLDRAIATIDRVCPKSSMEMPACRGNPSDFLESLDALLEGLARTPRWLSVDDWSGLRPYKVRIDPAVLLFALYNAAGVADGANLARDAVMETERGDFRLLDRLLEAWAWGQMYFDVNEATFFSVSCNFSGAGEPEEVGRGTRYYERYVSGMPNGDPCAHWTVSRAPEAMRRPVISAIPTLILSGEYDPITPSSWGDRVAAGLEHSYHFVMPRGGHGVLFDDGCAMAIMRAFLADPSAGPSPRCLQD